MAKNSENTAEVKISELCPLRTDGQTHGKNLKDICFKSQWPKLHIKSNFRFLS